MDAIFTLLLGFVAAAAAYVFQQREVKKLQEEKYILDMQLKKQVKLQAAREAALKTATARITYEKAKEDFLKKYNVNTASSPTSSSPDTTGSND